MKLMKRLLYFGNLPAPYTVNFLNELGKYIDIFAIFERNKASDRNQNWTSKNFLNFEGRILKGLNFKKEMRLSLGFIKYLKESYDYVIIANPLTPTGILTIYYLYLNKISFGIISEGGLVKEGWGFKEKIKKRILSKASFYLSGSVPGHNYFFKYGGSKNNIFEYPFASMFRNEILKKPTSPIERNYLKKELNISYDNIILSVGRIIKSKGFDTLIKIASELRSYYFIIVGGRPNKSLIKLMSHLNISNLIFIDHASPIDLRYYYKIADIFVLPTRIDTYGLVINEAMAYGLPVITTFQCVAGLHLISNDHNGFLIQQDDIIDFVQKIKSLMNNKGIRNEISLRNLNKIKYHSIENMAKTIFSIINRI